MIAEIGAVNYYKELKDLADIISSEFDNLSRYNDVTPWMDLIRTARQPQNFWSVDYIEPKPGLEKINEIIRKSETILYPNKHSLKLKEGLTADLSQQAAFNTIRARLRSEEGDISGSIEMFQEMLDSHYDELTEIRQSNLLLHCALAFLCCKMFDKSFECYQKHWALLKYSDPKNREKIGLWDNHIILHMSYWFFSRYDTNFQDFYAIKIGLNANELYSHKKIALMNFFEYDPSWVVSFCGLPFYNHARTTMPGLPVWEKKRSTPINVDARWVSEDKWEDTGAIGRERFYFDLYNKTRASEHQASFSKLDNYLYSYYYFQSDRNLERYRTNTLFRFMHNKIDYANILHVGCGTSELQTQNPVTLVDISEHVCWHIKQSGKEIACQSASVFLEETSERFDVCFACDLLQCIRPERLPLFLSNCSKKCKFLAASICTVEDIRGDILNQTSISNVPMHHTVTDEAGWRDMLLPYVDVQSLETIDDLIYVVGKCKLYE